MKTYTVLNCTTNESITGWRNHSFTDLDVARHAAISHSAEGIIALRDYDGRIINLYEAGANRKWKV